MITYMTLIVKTVQPSIVPNITMRTIEPVAQLVWMFLVRGIILATHPGSNIGSDGNSRRQDNKDERRFPCDRKLRSTMCFDTITDFWTRL
jgi:hypothetical protein